MKVNYTEKDMEHFLESVFRKYEIPFHHIPTRTYQSKAAQHSSLKYFPDYTFAWGGQFYMWELGIKNANKDRKSKQWELMQQWGKHGVQIRIILSMDALKEALISLDGIPI